MATTAAPKVTRVVPEDGPPFIFGMIILFAAIIPILFAVAYFLSPLDHVSPAVHGPTAAASAAPAEAAPAEATEEAAE